MFTPGAVYASKAEHKIKFKKKKATFLKKYSISIYEANLLLAQQNSFLIPLTFVSSVNRSEQASPDHTQCHAWTPPVRSQQGSLLMQVAALSLHFPSYFFHVFFWKREVYITTQQCVCPQQNQTFPAYSNASSP